jgi:hypothetical protein
VGGHHRDRENAGCAAVLPGCCCSPRALGASSTSPPGGQYIYRPGALSNIMIHRRHIAPRPPGPAVVTSSESSLRLA